MGKSGQTLIVLSVSLCILALQASSFQLKKKALIQRLFSTYTHVWPDMELGWRIIVGSIIGFIGAAAGSIGGIGGGGIFVPMLALVIGFDTKSAAAMSKCMVMATAGVTAYFNLRKRHPTLQHQPLIDYDLALLIQPSLVLGISIGVTFNVIFAEWMVTILLIALFLVSSARSCLKGVETWNNENLTRADPKQVEPKAPIEEPEYQPLPEMPERESVVRLATNVRWKEVIILVSVWLAVLALQVSKNNTTTCSVAYWILDLLQIPVTLGASCYEAVMLYKGYRAVGSRGDLIGNSNWKVHELVLCCGCALLAGAAGGLLGLGGGFILAPLLLEIGIPPQVSGATATFAITFSSSMCVVEYYLLQRFPVPYAVYFFGVAFVATLVGQLVVRRLVEMMGRASIIVFVLASTIFISAILLGANGIVSAIYKIENSEYMGFDSLCSDS